MTVPMPKNRISRLFDDQPAFIYGTAWKKDQTKNLVKEALVAGFTRIDTAAQPRHYQEALVGEALREAYSEGGAARKDIYVQTKYTAPAGQDLNNMPYDPESPLETQIHTSVASSLRNLRHSESTEDSSYIDCLLLHSPLPRVEETLEAWALLESYVPHQIRSLGISNVTLPVLKAIYEASTVKPAVVQNRFYPQTRYDVPLRTFCKEHDIIYQSFWTLTGNPGLLNSSVVTGLARAVDIASPAALYALVMNLGIVVLNGTTSELHMRGDLYDIRKVKEWAEASPREWSYFTRAFEKAIGENGVQ